MAYWTFRRAETEYHDGYRYAIENTMLLRQLIERDDAPVHPVGGVAHLMSPEDAAGFVRGAKETGATGWSFYDVATTPPWLWELVNQA